MSFVRMVARNKNACSFALILAAILLVRWFSQGAGPENEAIFLVTAVLLLGLPLGAIALAVLSLVEFRASRKAHRSNRQLVPQTVWEAAGAVVALLLSVPFLASLVVYGGLRYLHNRAEAAMPASTWTRFSSAKDDFTILFPEAPEESTQTVQHPSGPTTAHVTAASGGRGEGYLVTVTEAGVGQVPSLDSLEADLVKRSNGTLLGHDEVRTGSVSGRELRVASPERFLRVRIFTSGKRIYQVLVIRPSSAREDALGTRFLESFTLKGV
jgi:hypothetical protein